MLYLSKQIEIIVIISSIVMHEFAHILTSKLYGYKDYKLEISMFGGSCYLNIDNTKKLSSFIIYISGVIVNILVIILSYYMKKIKPEYNIFDIYIHYNIILIIFSLIPVYPLDGYRMLSLFICNKKKIINCKNISRAFILIMFIINIYFKSVGLLILNIFLMFKDREREKEEYFVKIKTICNLYNKRTKPIIN